MCLFKDVRILGCELVIIYILNFVEDNVYYRIILLFFVFGRRRVLNLLDGLFIIIFCRFRYIIYYCFKFLLNIRRNDRVIVLNYKFTYIYI